MPYKDENKQREYQRKWAKRKRTNGYYVKYNIKLRERVIAYLGGKCIYCGCDVHSALELNHIDGGGGKGGKYPSKRSKGLYLSILRGEQDGKIELTCRICNNYHYLKKLKKLDGDWIIKWIPPK